MPYADMLALESINQQERSYLQRKIVAAFLRSIAVLGKEGQYVCQNSETLTALLTDAIARENGENEMKAELIAAFSEAGVIITMQTARWITNWHIDRALYRSRLD